MAVLTKRHISLPQLVLANPFGKFIIPERMVWTSSSLKMFRADRRKFFWKYIARLRPHYRDKALMIGGAFHRCLGRWYYGRRAAMSRIVRNFEIQLLSDAELSEHFLDQRDYDELLKAIATFRGMVMGYASIYRKDRNKWRIEPGLIERKFVVDCGKFDYSGLIDLVIRKKRKSSRKTIVEHKTTSKITGHYIERLPLDTQVRGYIFGASKGLLVPVNDVLYDVIEKCKLRKKTNEDMDEFTDRVALAYESNPSRYFYREPLLFSRSDIHAFEYELHQTHREYQFIVDGHQGDPIDPRSWGPNDKMCNEFFKLCPYFTLCTQGLDQGTGRLFEQGDEMHEELADE